MQELDLTPTQATILIVICLILLAIIWFVEVPDNASKEQKSEDNTDHVGERYGRYIQLQGKYYN